jgi:hypothetical protein
LVVMQMMICVTILNARLFGLVCTRVSIATLPFFHRQFQNVLVYAIIFCKHSTTLHCLLVISCPQKTAFGLAPECNFLWGLWACVWWASSINSRLQGRYQLCILIRVYNEIQPRGKTYNMRTRALVQPNQRLLSQRECVKFKSWVCPTLASLKMALYTPTMFGWGWSMGHCFLCLSLSHVYVLMSTGSGSFTTECACSMLWFGFCSGMLLIVNSFISDMQWSRV